MKTFRVATILISMLLSTGCAYSEDGSIRAAGHLTSNDVPKCDIDAYTKKFHGDSQRICMARIIAKRCNETDACQFRCQLSGEWDEVGGGCHHMCNYGEEYVLPEGLELCKEENSANEAER
jgi:hypothetical protein